MPAPDLTIRPRAPWEPWASRLAWVAAASAFGLSVARLYCGWGFAIPVVLLAFPVVAESVLVLFNVRGTIWMIEGSQPGERPLAGRRASARYGASSYGTAAATALVTALH